jgi:hypothetical protein
MINVKCWFHKDMQDIEYSYNKFNALQKNSAIASMYYVLRDGPSFSLKTHSVDKQLLECIIKKLDPTFDEFGMIVNFSRKYEKLTIEIVEQIYEECRKANK